LLAQAASATDIPTASRTRDQFIGAFLRPSDAAMPLLS
jgi:hypothetical protein